jgi:hypothetical protein
MSTPLEHASSQQQRQPGRTRRANLVIGLLLSVATLLICVGGIELAGFIWERKTAEGPFGWSLVASRRLHFERRGEESAPYYLFEPGRRYAWRGVTVEINSRGLRNEEFMLPKPADTYRILNVGDSIAFGWEVPQEDTYGKKLERSLNSRGNGHRYEVINAAVPTWNVEAEQNFLTQEGLGYEPDLVILDLTIVNDIRGRGPEMMLGQNRGVVRWMRENTYSWPFLATQTRFLLARQVGPEAFRVLNPPDEVTKYYPLDMENVIWDRVWDPILAMHDATREQGIPFIIVAFPTAYQLSSHRHPDVPQAVLGERAVAAGIPFVDLLPTYEQACRDAGPDACEGYENLLFIDVWMHPNAFGHELAAREVEKVMAAYLPAD